MTNSIPVSILNIIVSLGIIVGCIYGMYKLIKHTRAITKIKNSNGEQIGSKRTGSVFTTVFMCIFLIMIILFALVILVMHIISLT